MFRSPIIEHEQCAQLWNEILLDMSKVLLSVLQITGHNRARQRDKLVAVMEDLASLQEEVDKADSLFHSILNRADPKRHHVGVLGAFVLYHVLQVMLEYFLLGFENNLYAVYEYAYIYW